MLDTDAAAMWRSILDKTADGLALDTGEGQAEFGYLARQALRGLPLEVLRDIARSVGAVALGATEPTAQQALIRNYVATATGWGTDVDVDAGTHCVLCRAPYRVEPPRAENPRIAHLVYTDEACGYWTAVRGADGLPVIEKPEPAPVAPETRRQLLARRIDPYVGPGALRVPPLREAIAARAIETIGSLLDPVAHAAETLRTDPRVHAAALTVKELPADIAHCVRLDVAPVLRRNGWKALYFAASRAHRAVAMVRRRATRAEKAIAAIAIRASNGVEDREGPDDRI